MTQASFNVHLKEKVERLGLHDPPAPDDTAAHAETISPDVASDIHRDAIRLKRGEFFQALPWALPAAVVGIVTIAEPRAWIYFMSAVLVAIRPMVLGWEWWRLRREQPVAQFEREWQEQADAATVRREGSLRLAAVTPITTYGLIVTIVIVAMIEWATGGAHRSAELAGLVKPAVGEGEWWRLLSATYLHGSFVHVYGNVIALILLGLLTEAYDGRWRVPLVYLAAAIGGSLLSTLLDPRTAIGASGGILGLAGYLLIAARRQSRATRVSLRKNMWRILGSVALSGIAGYAFIDNAGHAGGAIAGMLVATIVVPAGNEASPQRIAMLDRLGWISAGVIAAGAIFTIVKLLP